MLKLPRTPLAAIRIVAWSAVVVVSGLFLAALDRPLPANVKPPLMGEVTSSGLAEIGGPFELTTHTGKTFTDADVVGRPYVMFFGFTYCPDICPTTLAELTNLMAELGTDADRFTPLFITVDSARDDQTMLAEYMTAFDSRIIALRGTPEQTDAAVKAFKAYYKKVPLGDGAYTIDHTAGVYLMSADGSLMGMMDMHEPRSTKLAKLRRLIETAA